MAENSYPYYLFKFQGKDVRDFFHRMTTQDFKNLKPLQIKTFCFLNAQASIITWGYAQYIGDTLEVLTMDDQLYDKLEKFIFAEDISCTKNLVKVSTSEEGSPWCLCLKGLKLYFYPNESSQSEVPALELREREVQSGLLRPNFDSLENMNPLELLMDDSVHPSKGCYPGQEILERMFSRNIEPAKRIVYIEKCTEGAGSNIIRLKDKKTTGSILAKTANGFAIAIVRKDQAYKNQEVDINSKSYTLNLFNHDQWRKDEN